MLNTEIHADDVEMDQAEIDSYRFRVGRTHFQDFSDAQQYAESCIYATCVEHLNADGVWRVFWQDGEIEYNRPGFAVLKTVSRSRGKVVI